MSLDPTLYPPIPEVDIDAPRPFWSVIVPAYKAKYLAQALQSVLSQAPPREQMEILVINDCSPEDLEPIVRKVGGDRVSYTRQPVNLGTYPTENAGVTMSHGHWIHILNDDDWVLPGFYEIFRRSLEHAPDSVGAAFCGFANFDSAGNEMSQSTAPRMTPGVLENWLDQLAISNKLHPISAVFRRRSFEQLGGFNLNLNYCADWEFNKRVAANYDWWYEPRVLACYRVNESSVSSQSLVTGQQLRDLRHAIDLSERYLPADKCRQLSAASREHYALYGLRVALSALKQTHYPMAMAQLQEALGLSQSPRVLEALIDLLAQPAAAPLRQVVGRVFAKVEVVDQSANAKKT